MEKVEVTEADENLAARIIQVVEQTLQTHYTIVPPVSAKGLDKLLANHRNEATRANDEEIARGQAAMWLLASILKAKSAFESGDRNTAGVDPDAWDEAARSILGDPS